LTGLPDDVIDSDMTAAPLTSIRDQYKAMTRDRILDAALEVLASEPGALTIVAVAQEAGVTQRTIFRHFATREQLLEAVWPRMQARVNSRGFPTTAQDLIETPRRLFPRFDEQQNLVIASVYSEGGREIRLKSNDSRQAAMLACVDDALPDLPEPSKRRRAAVVQLINSAYAWSVLKDFWGLDGVEAGEAAAEAIAVLLGTRPPTSGKPLPTAHRDEEVPK
jgi:AcrR family transcriptional regulator